MSKQVVVLVEVDVATARPPRIHARTYTWLAVESRNRTNVQVEAEWTAMQMAMSHPHVVMVLGARIIEWIEEDECPSAAAAAAPAGFET